MNIYLAAPFFNVESKKVVQMLMDKLEQLGHKIWSPMRDGITCPKDADREMRLKVFNLDCEQLHWADCVVALLDYPLPIHQTLLLREKSPEGVSKDTPIQLPDPGTVFEIGYVNGLNAAGKQYRHVIGYMQQTAGSNLMVTEACDCVVDDLEKLERAIQFVEAIDDAALMLLKIQYQKQMELKEL